jgi:hypothetical protein
MKKILLLVAITGIILLGFTSCVGGGKAVKDDMQMVECLFPRTPTLDGSFDEPAWQGVKWEKSHHVLNQPVDNDADGSYEFAVVADSENMYIAYKILDDDIVKGEAEWPDYYQDDSIEYFFDMGNEKKTSYDKNDAQVTIAADNIGLGLLKIAKDEEGAVDPEAGLKVSGKGVYADTMVEAICVEMEGGWAVEIKQPLKTSRFDITPEDGLIIGWGAQYNDDDAGGGRDHQIIWHEKDVANTSWMKASVFSHLKFVAE